MSLEASDEEPVVLDTFARSALHDAVFAVRVTILRVWDPPARLVEGLA